MTVIEPSDTDPTLSEAIDLARDGIVVLRKPDGSAFAPVRPDGFEVGAELPRNNPDFPSFLRQLSREEAPIGMDDLRNGLAL